MPSRRTGSSNCKAIGTDWPPLLFFDKLSFIDKHKGFYQSTQDYTGYHLIRKREKVVDKPRRQEVTPFFIASDIIDSFLFQYYNLLLCSIWVSLHSFRTFSCWTYRWGHFTTYIQTVLSIGTWSHKIFSLVLGPWLRWSDISARLNSRIH